MLRRASGNTSLVRPAIAPNQVEDIQRGRQKLTGFFGAAAGRFFSPPHDRLSQATLEALAALGFRLCTGGPRTFEGLRIPDGIVTFTCDVDGSRRSAVGRRARSANEILKEIESAAAETVGLVLHASEFECFSQFADLLRSLSSRNGRAWRLAHLDSQVRF